MRASAEDFDSGAEEVDIVQDRQPNEGTAAYAAGCRSVAENLNDDSAELKEEVLMFVYRDDGAERRKC